MSSTKAGRTASPTRLLQNASMSQIATLIVTLLAVRWLARAIYRVYFHPLSKFPGPKLHVATRIPQLVAQWTGTPHKRLAELHRKYGNVVRISPDEVSFIDAQAWKDVYGHGTKGTPGGNPHKHWLRYGTSINNEPSLILARDNDHTRMRRIFNPAFSDRALKQQEPLFMKYVNLLDEKLRQGLKEDQDRKYDMVRMYNFTTFDVMGDLTFGEPLHMLDNAEYDPWVKVIFASIKTGSRLSIMMHYPLLWKAFKKFVPRSMMVKRMAHFKNSVDRVTKRLEKGRDSEGVDLWDLVLSQPEGKGLTRGEMDSNASLFMIAGTETTATLLSGLTYLLLKNPEAMKQLTHEIRKAFDGLDAMSIETVASLPYLNACVKEAFRLYPPVVTGMPRRTPPEGSTICGQYIPSGWIVSVPQLACYTSESNFKEPLSFLPERWLGDERFKNDKRAALQPFSVGTRDCVGKNMAYHEMRLIIARVLLSFDLELCPESEHWTDQYCYTLWEKKPLMCKLKTVN
ncbi:cytochrome P450 [Lentithecium fluviatile CBS 122367]|uniref:Cytochrome P450 n=1 Tax=Lentithecium fluviatile CBS 122367 TaxID=1168545 RepID=A0A6G1JA24_9PLEO|nr:cytochrome P450 [Lentithecium fluviatile CBS 122367]